MANSATIHTLRGHGRMSPIFLPRLSCTIPAMSSEATAITTLDSTGRVVVPAEVRKKLGLATGARFSVDVVGDRIELTLEAPPESAVVRKAGRLVLAASGEALDAAAAIRTERQTQSGRARRR